MWWTINILPEAEEQHLDYFKSQLHNACLAGPLSLGLAATHDLIDQHTQKHCVTNDFILLHFLNIWIWE